MDSKTAILPCYLKPTGKFALARFGRSGDGGYLVDERDVAGTTSLISLGVNDEWSFERQFLDAHPVPLHAYDGSTSRAAFAGRIAKGLAKGGRGVRGPLRALLEYGRFFSGPSVHHPLMVGFSHLKGSVSLGQVLEAHSTPTDQLFLKVDIEGSEYRILQDIVTYAERISGLAIEFHDFDLHEPRIKEFVQALPLQLAHVHCNNYSPLAEDGTPLTVEVTFSSHGPALAESPTFPHLLDAPNNPRLPGLEIAFRDKVPTDTNR